MVRNMVSAPYTKFEFTCATTTHLEAKATHCARGSCNRKQIHDVEVADGLGLVALDSVWASLAGHQTQSCSISYFLTSPVILSHVLNFEENHLASRRIWVLVVVYLERGLMYDTDPDVHVKAIRPAAVLNPMQRANVVVSLGSRNMLKSSQSTSMRLRVDRSIHS